MAERALTRLRNLLNLEIQTRWRERAFAGGVAAFCERWTADAQADAVHPGLLQEIVERLSQYAGAESDERARLLNSLLDLLDQPPPPDPALENVDRVGQRQARQPEATQASNPAETATRPAHQQSPKSDTAETEAPESSDTLSRPITDLKGIGVKRAEQYARLGIETVEDLIWHLPHRYDDYSRVRPIAGVEEGESLSIIANLRGFSQRKFAYKREILQANFSDGSGTVRANWWNQSWLKNRLSIGKTYRLSGVVGLYMGHKTLENPYFEEIGPRVIKDGPIMPVYGLTAGLRSSDVSRQVQQALRQGLSSLRDPLPEPLRHHYNLTPLTDALRQIHSPETPERLADARKRIIFDDFFFLQLGVQRRRQEIQHFNAPPMPVDDELLADYRTALTFALTGAQQRTLDELRQDMARSVPMSRLVQGDVGSGKTVVAAGAMLIAAANGFQSALLAPTQILAEQHFRALSKLLADVELPDGVGLNVSLLTGRVTGQERESALAGLADGSIQVVVGTTALIQENVDFASLGFVVVDEQHRFGVGQRAAARDKGGETAVPHLLVMSATPIPRSLALTVYGDLDVSVIDEMPPGRTPIKTKRFLPTDRERLYSFVRRQVQDGRQAYLIYPLVEESEVLDVGAAVDAHARLSKEVFPDLRVGLLHGRLKGAEKDDVMRSFAGGDLDILVSTSVVEVGVDVPNATVMLIEDAERFGLAQLHQFRGRVGRGGHESYCALISRVKDDAQAERLNALAETTDGFILAEKDLELRGPGDFLGTRQSGLPDMKLASLSDLSTLHLAQEAAQDLLRQDTDLDNYPQVQEKVERFWRGHGDLS
ncbi:MAG: ATP-dependent DNA helicase RecG [Caldilineaceae bacterium]|nr:ATP-dependent DNA helicase RecG [Caldilineaceae bacterium]